MDASLKGIARAAINLDCLNVPDPLSGRGVLAPGQVWKE
jgi:hypothetical protein